LGATAVAQSIVSYYDWDFPTARRFALQAIEANPSYELGHTWYGYMLTFWGWPFEARAQLNRSLELNPSKAAIYRFTGHTYCMQRDYTNAIIWYRRAINLDHHHSADFLSLGHAFVWIGDESNACNAFVTWETLDKRRTESEAKQYWQQMLDLFKTGGYRALWQKEFKEDTENNPDGDYYWKAYLQVRLGNTGEAFKLLQKSFDAHENASSESDEDNLLFLLFDPGWDGVHDDPRFKHLLDEVGFTKVMPPAKK
jgi:tetratricopeptide (TPR) repeat protein